MTLNGGPLQLFCDSGGYFKFYWTIDRKYIFSTPDSDVDSIEKHLFFLMQPHLFVKPLSKWMKQSQTITVAWLFNCILILLLCSIYFILQCSWLYSFICFNFTKTLYLFEIIFFWGGCSSAGRAGRLVIGRSLVQILAPGRAELYVKVSLSKILNPMLLISEGPVMRCWLVQGVPCPRPEIRLGLAPAATPCHPMERDERLRTVTWHNFLLYSAAGLTN